MLSRIKLELVISGEKLAKQSDYLGKKSISDQTYLKRYPIRENVTRLKHECREPELLIGWYTKTHPHPN